MHTISFQNNVRAWMLECFGPDITYDARERNHRFLEESLELVQACGCTASEAHQLVDYVFNRPVGEKEQEAGGVQVTMAALCIAQSINMEQAGVRELDRIWKNMEKIRAKQAAKPAHSPLPGPDPCASGAAAVAINHELKTDPWPYDAVAAGIKTFEIRRNDRDYQVGENLLLKKTQYPGAAMRAGKPLVYTGDECVVEVTHIMEGPAYGLADGWVIMSFKLLPGIDLKLPATNAVPSRQPSPLIPFGPDYAIRGRAEAVKIILGLDPELGLDDCTDAHPIADTGDYGTVWNEDKLKDLFRVGKSIDNSPLTRITELAEALYWEMQGKRSDQEFLLRLQEGQRIADVEVQHTELLNKVSEWRQLAQDLCAKNYHAGGKEPKLVEGRAHCSLCGAPVKETGRNDYA